MKCLNFFPAFVLSSYQMIIGGSLEHLFILVGGDCNELGFLEGNVGDQPVARANAHDVELGLVLMEGVQHDLKHTDTSSHIPVEPVPKIIMHSVVKASNLAWMYLSIPSFIKAY